MYIHLKVLAYLHVSRLGSGHLVLWGGGAEGQEDYFGHEFVFSTETESFFFECCLILDIFFSIEN